jgi:hypothetical protein
MSYYLPQGESKCRICGSKLFAKDVAVSHEIVMEVAKMPGPQQKAKKVPVPDIGYVCLRL